MPTIADPGLGIKAFTASLPAGWMLQGTVMLGPSCNTVPYVLYRAYAPDGITEMRRFPRFDWVFRANPGAAKPGDCQALGGPATAREFLDHFIELSGSDQGMRVIGPMSVSPLVAQRMARQANALNQNNRMPGFHAVSDVAAIRIETMNGSFVVEQRVTASVECRLIASGPLQGGGCSATIDVLRAPQGQLDALAQFVDQNDLTKLVSDPGWEQQMLQELRGIWQRQLADLTAQEQAEAGMLRQQYEQMAATMQRNHEAFMAQQQSQFESAMRGANAAMNARSTAASDWVDYSLDQQTVMGPDGRTAKVSSGAGQTWADGQGHWYQTHDPNTNPNGVLPGNWTRAARVHGNGTPY